MSARLHDCPCCGSPTEGGRREDSQYAMCQRCLDGDRMKLGPDALGRRIAPDLESAAIHGRLRRIERAVSEAVDSVCTCGGRAPDDPDGCLACQAYHRIRRALRAIGEWPS